jgi:uroporphyrinogen decarboxylase
MMNSRERIRALLNDETADRVGFWLGNPTDETKEIYYKHFGVNDDIELATEFRSDFFWYSPEYDPSAWKHPEGKPMFDYFSEYQPDGGFAQPGRLSECEDIKQVEAFNWPNPDYLDFTSTIQRIDQGLAKGMGIFSGMWIPFFHTAYFFFGIENFLVKMHTHPDIIEAVIDKIVEFYLKANRRCLDAMGEKIDAAFFGNDLGSQQDLLISPEAFKRFILPGYKKIVEQAHSYGIPVVLHSCGAISKIIPLLIDIGIDGLHPLQARAKGMEAENLAREFKGKLLFIGGVDTQQLLPCGTKQEVRDEVLRLIDLFGTRYVVSPSHEALLPNVSPENAIAMRDAVIES